MVPNKNRETPEKREAEKQRRANNGQKAKKQCNRKGKKQKSRKVGGRNKSKSLSSQT